MNVFKLIFKFPLYYGCLLEFKVLYIIIINAKRNKIGIYIHIKVCF